MHRNPLETIQTIIQILNDSQIAKSNFSSVLETLAAQFDVKRSFLLIYQTASDKLNPVAVNGLNAADFRRLENKVEKLFSERFLIKEKFPSFRA